MTQHIRLKFHRQGGKKAIGHFQGILFAGVFDVVFVGRVMLMIAIVVVAIVPMMLVTIATIGVTDVLRDKAMRLGGQVYRHIDEIRDEQQQGEQPCSTADKGLIV